jgi:two-component system, NtrC family, response regulator AtoC
MERGEFRSDLFYRLEGIRVEIPPLRARRDDIVALAQFFVARLAGRMGLVAPGLTEGAREVLRGYAWPGNVRELRNTIERALVMNPESEFLTESDLVLHAPGSVRPPPPSESMRAAAATLTAIPAPSVASLRSSLDEVEEKAIREALAKTNGNQSAAARMLGIGRHALIKRIEAYGIDRPRKTR